MDARNVTGVLGLGIAAVVDLAIEEPPIQFPRDVVYCRFPLIDGTGNQPAVLRAAIDIVACFIASRTPTLVACGAGMSRSPAIVTAAMATTKRFALADVLEKLTAGQPHDVSPSLLAEISDIHDGFREGDARRNVNSFSIHDSRRHPASVFVDSETDVVYLPPERCPKCDSTVFRVAVGFEVPSGAQSQNDTSWFALALECCQCRFSRIACDDETA